MESLRKLRHPAPCSLIVACMPPCGQAAWWWVNGETVCDAHLVGMAQMNSDNATFLRPACEDLAARRATKAAVKKGASPQ